MPTGRLHTSYRRLRTPSVEISLGKMTFCERGREPRDRTGFKLFAVNVKLRYRSSETSSFKRAVLNVAEATKGRCANLFWTTFKFYQRLPSPKHFNEDRSLDMERTARPTPLLLQRLARSEKKVTFGLIMNKDTISLADVN
jgi:hypothetical protein